MNSRIPQAKLHWPIAPLLAVVYAYRGHLAAGPPVGLMCCVDVASIRTSETKHINRKINKIGGNLFPGHLGATGHPLSHCL